MENGLNLHQRVALITGPMSSTVSSIVLGLTQLGADCVVLDPDKSVASAFINQINDQREIKDKYGRAAVIPCDFKSEEVIKDAVGKAAQTFGGLDIYIDALMINQPTPMDLDAPLGNLTDLMDRHLKATLMTTQIVLAYLKSRKKGRILYMLNESPVSKIKDDVVGQAVRSGLINMASYLAKQVSEYNVTVNAMSLALTEEYVLAHDKSAKSIKEAVERMKQIDPATKITEPDKISQTVGFLVSPLGATMNGQHLRLT